MNKSSFLLLPTVLAVSTAARTQRSSAEIARAQGPNGSSKTKHVSKQARDAVADGMRKSVSIDFVFNVNR